MLPARAAGKLFQACDRSEVVIVVLPAVLAEFAFVLEYHVFLMVT